MDKRKSLSNLKVKEHAHITKSTKNHAVDWCFHGKDSSLQTHLQMYNTSKEVADSIPHVSVVLITTVRPTMVGGFVNLVVSVPESLLVDIRLGISKVIVVE